MSGIFGKHGRAFVVGAIFFGVLGHVISVTTYTGTVKWYNVAKGFGFITKDGGGDVFVHQRDIRGVGLQALTFRERVQFTIENSDKGEMAKDVRRIGSS